MKLRYFPCYHDEWLVGQAGLDNACRGLYLTACLLMYSHGGPIEIGELRRNCHDHGQAFNRQLKLLVKTGKLTVNERQIANKRVINELQKRDKRSEDGEQNIAKRWKNNGLADEVVLPHSNTNQNQNQNHKEEKRAREARPSLAAEFNEFWLAYPHKVGKGAAETKYRVARKVATQAELLAGITGYKRTKRDDAPWCNPATWLNQRRWEDQPDLPLANGHDDAPRPAVNPKIIGHSLPCSCANCSRWVEQHRLEA